MGLNYHQSKDVWTEIHNYWLIQLGNYIMSTFDQKWKELGLNMQVIRKAPEVIVHIILALF